jgi:hypothetical protein
VPPNDVLEQRYQKFRRMGVFAEGEVRNAEDWPSSEGGSGNTEIG